MNRELPKVSIPDLEPGVRDQYLEALSYYCKQIGLDVPASALNLCLEHLFLVVEMNKVVNLTRITNLNDALILHIIDSLILLPYLDKAPSGTFLDMGAGAGFPGVPLAICSHRHLVALDSVGKKVSAINQFAHTLNLNNIVAVHDRLESYALQHHAEFSAVVARAVAPLNVLIEYARPFIIHDGLLIITKGNPEQSEIDSGLAAASTCGFTLIDHSDIELPLHLGHRSIYIFKCSFKSKIKLPRPVGVARKSPIGM